MSTVYQCDGCDVQAKGPLREWKSVKIEITPTPERQYSLDLCPECIRRFHNSLPPRWERVKPAVDN